LPLAQEEANLVYAQKQLDRQAGLARARAGTPAQLDLARALYQQSGAHIAQLKSQIQQMEASLEGASYSLNQRQVMAQTEGRVQDVYFRAGEYVPASVPVLSVLPPDNVFVRFFVPETEFSKVHLGQRVRILWTVVRPPGYDQLHRATSSPAGDLQPGQPGAVFKLEARTPGGWGLSPGQPVQVRPLTSNFVIDVHGLTKRRSKVAVNGTTSIPEGGMGILGPNGSGKTTQSACVRMESDAGSAPAWLRIVRQSEEIKRQVGYMTQKFSFWEDLSIRENLEFVARVYELVDGKARVDATIKRLELENRETQLAGELSGGWKQRMALAACMLHSPRLLLLDEPTAGVDPKARRDLQDEIHRLSDEGLTVLVSTHYMDGGGTLRSHRLHQSRRRDGARHRGGR
jgi:ABC-type Na+ transport system ATPase subunit NatA